MNPENKASKFRKGLPVLPSNLEAVLREISNRHLSVKLRQFPALGFSILVVLGILQALVDRYFKLSLEVRTVLLSIDGLVALVLFWQYVAVPIYRKLSPRSAALLVERKIPDFDSALISAVEFCTAKPEDFPMQSHAVVTQLVSAVEKRALMPGMPAKVVDSRPLRIKVRWACAAAVLLLAVISLAGVHLSFLLGQRIFLSQNPLPGDTTVIPLTGDFMVDAGGDAALAVKALGVIPPSASLIIGEDGETTTIPVDLVKSGGNNLYQYKVRNVRKAFTYRFVVNDGESREARVKVNIPPTLRSIRFFQKYPAYTGLPDAIMSPGNLRLMEGSKFVIEGVASEPLRTAKLLIKGEPDTTRVLSQGKDPATFSVELNVPGKGWKSMQVRLDAGEGLVSSNEPVYRIDLVVDRAPSAVMLLPKKDRITVVPGAQVPYGFKAGDDFGMKQVSFCYRVMKMNGDESLTPLDQVEQQLPFDATQKTFSGNGVLDLSKINAPVGSSISCWIEVTDNNSVKGYVKTVSKEKVIAVVSEEQKRMELLELMTQRAKEVEKLYDQQRLMNQRAEDSLRGK